MRHRPLFTWPSLAVFAGLFALGLHTRLVNLSDVGVHGFGDLPQYWTWGQNWASGNYDLDGFYRPVLQMFHGLAMMTLGINDHAIKYFNAGASMLNLVLVFVLGAMISRSPWVGLAAVVAYGFCPRTIEHARIEMPHNLSTTFVLLAVLFFVMFWRRFHPEAALRTQGRALLLLGLSAFSLSLAGHTHNELALLAPVFPVFILARWLLPSRDGRWRFPQVVWLSALYSAVYFLPYAVGVAIFTWPKVLQCYLAAQQVNLTSSYNLGFWGTLLFMARLDLGYSFSSDYYGPIFFGIWAVIILCHLCRKILGQRGGDDWLSYLPIALAMTHICAYAAIFSSPLARLFLPLAPLVAIAVFDWHFKLLGCFTRRFFLPEAAVLALALLLGFTSWPGDLAQVLTHSATRYRTVSFHHVTPMDNYQTGVPRAAHKLLKDKVDANHRLLLAPYSTYYNLESLINLPIYFAKDHVKAIWDKDVYRLGDLPDIVRFCEIKYVLFFKSDQDPTAFTFDATSSAYKRFRDTMPAFAFAYREYSPAKEQERWTSLLAATKALLLYESVNCQIWELSACGGPGINQGN